jgi:uncharacterized protein
MATVQHKTPGVYISEPNSFPPSIVGLPTAVPVFIGYTEFALNNKKNIPMTPVAISSMAEFRQYFGGGFQETYYLYSGDPTKVPATDTKLGTMSLYDGGPSYILVETGSSTFNLYDSMQIFYNNGGGDCFVVSCGTYGGGGTPPAIAKADLLGGLQACANLIGPTMVAIPDAVLLASANDYADVIVAMLNQCLQRQDRIALLDVRGADTVTENNRADVISAFRNALAGAPPEAYRYGAAYFPALQTSVVSASDLDITSFAASGYDALTKALTDAVKALYPGAAAGQASPAGQAIIDTYVANIGKSVPDPAPGAASPPGTLTHSILTNALTNSIPGMRALFTHMADSQNVLPPSGALAGVITEMDTLRGVWNAPANTGIANLVAPTMQITDAMQEDMNAPAMGKAINAIRVLPGRGPLIWGARTLDSTSNDWRYIQVRRTMIYVEQSIKTALNAFVFAPNTASTWTTVVSMVESFLHGLWASGGLMGNSAAEAYNVKCGLGVTMTSDDILNGNMIVAVVLQMVHPAEFIELVFTQQMAGGS